MNPALVSTLNKFKSIILLTIRYCRFTTHKLNGQNFLQWSQPVKLKMGYLDGSIDMPEADDPSHKI